MKLLLRRIFSLLLSPLESGEGTYEYKPSHRSILLFVSVMFIGLASIVRVMADGQDSGYLFPVLIFGVGGILGLIVGLLGEDRAVAKIWGTGKK
jgi:hypothetical protein